MKINTASGRILVALDRGTKEPCGEARRVRVKTSKGSKGVWLVEWKGELSAVLNTWDQCAHYFKDHGCIVRIRDQDGESKIH